MITQGQEKESLQRSLADEVQDYVEAHRDEIHERILVQAVTTGDIRMVQYLLGEVIQDTSERLAEEILEVAVKAGHLPMTALLLWHTDLPFQNESVGDRVLAAAAEAGNLAMTRLLLHHKELPRSQLGLTQAIRKAFDSDQTSIVRELARAGAGQGYDSWGSGYAYFSTLLIEAAREGDAEMVAALLEGDADINFEGEGEYSWGPPFGETFTALTKSVSGGHFDVALILLEAGADPDLDYPLILAVDRNDLPLVQLLLRYGACPERPRMNGGTESALIEASLRGYSDIVQVLIEAGANVHAEDIDGDNALTYATVLGHEDIAMALIQSGADRSHTECLLADPSAKARLFQRLQWECERYSEYDTREYYPYRETAICPYCEAVGCRRQDLGAESEEP